ncbi:MAG: hypothetical protein A2Z59_10210 [Nitrospinae bacterium RIFCSPLOWO2_02_39_17]|nr:MAG: hypothetical protein A2Z59_10210 [Nitrospinae bacterium RIFCSPLOWO2_02_39_17]
MIKINLVGGLFALLLTIPFSVNAEIKDPLLQKLVEKGTITMEEAEDIAGKSKAELPKGLQGISIGGLAYLDYSAGTTGHVETNYNKFSITRGYINIKKDITPWFKARVTSDITQITNTSNSQRGDIELRLKYYYIDILTSDDFGMLSDNDLRIGVSQTPWLDFQQSINIYRMQGSMFQERFKNFNSADMGIGLLGNFGGKLSKELQENVGYHTPYSGRYGSYHIGIYNGGGYYAAEDNQNKVVEGRITLRPLPDLIPGLQLSYLGVSGKGNKSTDPEWTNNSGLLSCQNRYIVLTGEYTQAKGQQDGSDEKKKRGYSVFGNLKIPLYDRVAIMGRYDVWDPDTDSSNDTQNLLITGLSYKVHDNNYLLIVYEQLHYENAGYKDDKKGQVVFQVSF